MNEAMKKNIGSRLRRQRESMNLTREVFAEQVNLSSQFVAEIELGKKGLSIDTLMRICENLNISADYILFGTSSRPNGATPIDTLIKDIPAAYLSSVEDFLAALTKTIARANEPSDNSR